MDISAPGGLEAARAPGTGGAVPWRTGGDGRGETESTAADEQVPHSAFSCGRKRQLLGGRKRTGNRHLPGAGRGDGRGRDGATAEYGVRSLCDPAAQCTFWLGLVSGRHRD